MKLIMMNVKKLDMKEEANLARLIQRGDDKAKDMLVETNLPLVLHIAKRYKGPLPLEDRIQEGVTGLIRAAERFEPEKGVRFGTYAAWWIRQAISRAIANQSREIRIPVQLHVRLRRLEKESEHLGRKLGRRPTLDEMSKEVGLPRKKLSAYTRIAKTPISIAHLPGDTESGLKTPGHEYDGYEIGSPEKALFREVLRADVARSMGELKPRERYVIGKRFGLFGEEASTLNSIAKELGLSRERVRQIVKNALRKIKDSDHVEGLKAFY